MNCSHHHGVGLQQLPGHRENPQAPAPHRSGVEGRLVVPGGGGGGGGAPPDPARPGLLVPTLGTEISFLDFIVKLSSHH